MAAKTPRGFILYQGPSLLDGSPIVAIALTHSSNRKTGDMVQTYIIRSDVDPVSASRTGEDSAVCGDCKHRPSNGGACYVTLIHGPSSVYRAFKRGAYPFALDARVSPQAYWPSTSDMMTADLGRDRMVRLGTYGDPAAVPVWVWQALVSKAQGRTGYTHQWRNGDLDERAQLMPLRDLVMASVDSEEERTYALQLGWRYFRIRGHLQEPMGPREFVCPASDEAGKVKTCATCGACDGAQRGSGKASPVILAHGSKARRFMPIVPL